MDIELRDYFAGQAMKYMSLPTRGYVRDNIWKLEDMENFPFLQMSQIAYKWADAMMEARGNDE